ncbi:MAG: hypothetical protein ACTHOK_05985 [Nocardioidaceae bacterium]
MSPRHDHRGPAAAFVVLFLVAVLVMGNQMLARAVGGTTYLAFDRAPRVLLAVRPAPHDVRPSSRAPRPVPAVPPLMAAATSAAPAAHVATAPVSRTAPVASAQPRALRSPSSARHRHPRHLARHRTAHRGAHPAARAPDRTAGHRLVGHRAFAPGPAAHRAAPPRPARPVWQHAAPRERTRAHTPRQPARHAFGRGHGRRGPAGNRGHRR